MADFTTARRMMVDGQIRTSDITDHRIISAFQTVPRERFVAPSKTALAYLDIDVPVVDGDDTRRMLKPMVLAKLIQAAEIAETDRVLIVGCTTGYSAAIVASLAGSVVALDEGVAPAQAVKTLASLGAANVEVVRGPLTAGWSAGAPYDVLLVEGAIEVMPDSFRAQLREGGRLVCVRGGKPPQKAVAYRLIDGELSGRPIFDATAPLLPGFAEKPAFVF
ncbi:MAG TPA: protein-L-isoaspartate O-methyltransferase [Pseudorhodoplanes sp.]|nr:protein-L-isoaspartate O-methyltransferase [Pseudorhodoplanes sp.]